MSVPSSSLRLTMLFLPSNCFLLIDFRPLLFFKACSFLSSLHDRISSAILRLMALQVSTYSMFCTSVPPLFICLLFSVNCLVSAESLSGFYGLFWPAISIAVSVIAEATFSHSELRSVDVAKASNLLVSSVWYFVVLADSTAVFGFLHRWMSLALSSLVLMVKEPRTMRWSLPVLRLLMTETSVKVCGLFVRIKSVSFFVWPLGEIHVQCLLGLFLNTVFMIFNWCYM